jgi:glycosyltransferase involved in cell wall biosynthesis
MKISVIVSTYNSPEWLARVLVGYEQQGDADFEIVIADDGSGPATRELIERFSARGHLRLRHVWHEDDGFRKWRIVNRAIEEAAGDYLLFTDGDCIPRSELPRIAPAPGRVIMSRAPIAGCPWPPAWRSARRTLSPDGRFPWDG